jgi:hypothetical protein
MKVRFAIHKDEQPELHLDGTLKELDTLKELIDAAIAKRGSSGVSDETDFSDVTISIYCDWD